MLTIRDSADPHSADVDRDNEYIGWIQWYPGKEPRFVAGKPFVYLTIGEMNYLIEQLNIKTKP